MIVLKTELLTLRTWRDEDLDAMAAIDQDPKGDFDHPKLAADSPIRPHMLYRISREKYLKERNA